ncbi:MAG: BatD family protein [Pseudomonadales bacterium]
MVSPRLGCLALALVLWTVSAVAAVDARVDRTTVDEMQSLQLTLRITGTNDADTLDLAPLEKDFEVQGTSTQSQMRMLNGEITAWVDYLVTLRPKRTGTLTIPALDVGGDRSQAITVQVRPVAPELRRQIDRLVYFEVTTDADTVYVQGQLLYTRRLYYTSGVQIYGDLPGAPEVADAVVLPLGETTQNTTMLNDTRYGVLEQRYAIFPEHSGALTIPGFSVASSVRLADGRRGIRVAADDKTITVLPIPAIWPKDVPWLPASALSLSEDWDPDMTNVNAGTSMRRAVQVTVTGNRGSAVPPLITTVDDRLIRQYPEAPVMEDDTRGDRVVGHRQQVESLVPTWGGQVALPGVAVTWWDTASNQVRVNRLPARQLTIAGAPPPTAESPSDNVTPTPADVAPEEAPATVTTPLPTNALRWSGIAVLVLVLAGGVAVLLKRRRANASTQHEARWLSALRSALKARDGHAVREALLHAVMQRQACGRTRALSLLAEDPDWLRLTAALNNRLAPEATAWTSEIDDAAKRLAARQRIRRRISPGTAPALPPLYPHPGS